MATIPVVSLLKRLMEIPSTSEEEHEIGDFLGRYLTARGFTVEMTPISPDSNRCNVYAYLGESRKARTCLTSHMDTVPPHIGFSIKGDVIYGRGSCDDKGPMAAQIIAVEELRADGKIEHGDTSLLFVVGEEKRGPGMLAVNKMDLTWETVIFGEPTESKLAVGHKGHYVFELFVEDIAAHSGYFDEGRSANSVLVSLLEELKAIEYQASRILGSSTFHCGKIEGGAAYNVLAADAYALCSVRIAASLKIVEKQVLDATSRHPGVTLKKMFGYPETHLDHDIEGMFSFLTSSGSVSDTKISGLETMAVSYGTDVPRLRGNHKKYLYGPGSILHAHGPSEQVRIPDLVDSVAVYKRLVLNSLVKDCS
ncbi:hypothetical protein N7452_010614 [Penicillium brevicompactum]|uniref:Peptidase M20 dimerisation domain-containing protein n=1 Tax=Penicillium brevicompactum TaxID=5074 RepID=A0A9W9U671_PENBR|nr:hypothetical protein N7452_010614 [Penicillium brevicompactum]